MPVSALRGVLLDVDGTLLDSNDAHARSWEETFRAHGFDIPYDRIRSLIGKGGDKLLPELTGLQSDEGRGKALSDERKRRFKSGYMPNLRPTCGARDLVKHLRDDGLKIVVATSAAGDELDALLRQAEVDDLIEKATSSSDADNSKPDPDIIHAALAKSGLGPEAAIMIGDTPYDIEAAGRAGVRTVALRCGGWWDDSALGAAVAIYDDPAEVVRRYEEFRKAL
jgi:HAD superfamily hydrolase (TIGR01509 family)